MPKKAKELGALAVSRLKEPGLHSVGGVAGLGLQVAPTGTRSWILRVVVAGRRRDMGLGGYPDVTLAGAHAAAREARAKIAAGLDPIEHGKAARSALAASVAAAWTFSQCSAAYIKAQAPGWRNAKHAQQWTNTLATYVDPFIGSRLVRDVGQADIAAILEPIWLTKTETASRVRSRVELVLDWATTRGFREGPNPARWRGHLDKLMPKPTKVAKVEHHRALPAAAMGAFMVDLRAAEGLGARALELVILTAARSGEVRGAHWREFDLDAAVWNVPADRMKAHKAHRVPLSTAAVRLLRAVPHMKGSTLVFPSATGAPLSDMTLSAVLRRMGVDAVPHGFRSTFRDWAAEQTNYPRELAEKALAHTLPDATEAAYQRGDMFEKRAKMMQAWADFCGRSASAKVIPMKMAAK